MSAVTNLRTVTPQKAEGFNCTAATAAAEIWHEFVCPLMFSIYVRLHNFIYSRVIIRLYMAIPCEGMMGLWGITFFMLVTASAVLFDDKMWIFSPDCTPTVLLLFWIDWWVS
jgi:hypothetical protein